jgi:PEP-CTERM motif
VRRAGFARAANRTTLEEKPVSASRLIVCLAVAAWLGCAPGPVHANPFTFSVTPAGGAVSGEPGSTIGWGYTLLNPSLTDWLMLTAVSADVFEHVVLADAGIFDYPILAPGASVSMPWAMGSAGLYEITWDVQAPLGFTQPGSFIVGGEWWSGDPGQSGAAFLQLATDQTAAYSATVAAPAAVPEPSTLLLMTSALALLSLARTRRTSA